MRGGLERVGRCRCTVDRDGAVHVHNVPDKNHVGLFDQIVESDGQRTNRQYLRPWALEVSAAARCPAHQELRLVFLITVQPDATLAELQHAMPTTRRAEHAVADD